MQFLYHPDAGLPSVAVEGEAYRYLFKVRRKKRGDVVALRNLHDAYIYFYRIESVTRKEADLHFTGKEERRVVPRRDLHIGWCIVEPKVVEKSLPTLNEIGIAKISFIRCDRSQRSFVPDFERMHRILVNSSQQCGRSEPMVLERFDSVEAYLAAYPESAVLDFGGTPLPCDAAERSILVGCEGGFSDSERKLFGNLTIYGLDTPLILRSESAVATIGARLIL
ncbi:16S rRNA (uracil(1498)-N(3))-methyltransferase [Hydrogenimonas sp.]